MTKNYIKPEMEVISIYSEGMLASSVFAGGASGADVTIDRESDFDSFFNN